MLSAESGARGRDSICIEECCLYVAPSLITVLDHPVVIEVRAAEQYHVLAQYKSLPVDFFPI